MDPELPAAVATAAERLGYHTAWLPDHLLPPEDYGKKYGGVYEPLVTLSHLAARTSGIRLGTSVLVLPMRNPFVVAKQVATLARLSGDRVTLGLGAGWDRAEFAAVGSDFATRGERTDEGLALLRHLFSASGPFEGRYHGFDTGVFEPKPRRPVPIMVGGTSDVALRRAARFADEWQGVSISPERFRERVGTLRSLTRRRIRVGVRIEWPGGRTELDRALAGADAFRAAGADTLAVWFGRADGFIDRMAEFARHLR